LSGREIRFKDSTGKEIVSQGSNLSSAFMNSVAVTIPATIIPILIAAFAAYGFSWLNFPGRKFLFTIVVALLVVPLQIALVPILQDYTKLGLTGTFLAIWLAHTGFGLPLAIYLLFNYMNQLPRDILESAFIDGASNFTIFTKLILPLSVPALASFAIFQFLWVWNDYLVALVFLGNKTPRAHQRPGCDGRGPRARLAPAYCGRIYHHDPAPNGLLRPAALLRARHDGRVGQGIRAPPSGT
jgi:alpha-glucoside transport system permease protein